MVSARLRLGDAQCDGFIRLVLGTILNDVTRPLAGQSSTGAVRYRGLDGDDEEQH